MVNPETWIYGPMNEEAGKSSEAINIFTNFYFCDNENNYLMTPTRKSNVF